ncbi:MAG: CoA-binding protein, partial [bacterium]|nr:CoA-binding protein [bacterium]
DYPRDDRCDQSTWGGAERGFIRAGQQTGAKCGVLSTFSDTMSESVAARLMDAGIVSLAGIDAGLAGIRAAVDVGRAWRREPSPLLLGPGRQVDPPSPQATATVLDEAQSKKILAKCGVPIPPSLVVGSVQEATEAAKELGFPVVVKALGVAHKTEVGGVRLGLQSSDEVASAVTEMLHLAERFLVEEMVDGAVAELIVGVARDPQLGPYLLVGGGGILVELVRDSISLLLPVTRDQVVEAIGRLRCAPLFRGFRGAPRADLNAAADAVLAVASWVEKDPDAFVELDINPLLLLAEGHGVVAADALIKRHQQEDRR